jgi:plastocyanin
MRVDRRHQRSPQEETQAMQLRSTLAIACGIALAFAFQDAPKPVTATLTGHVLFDGEAPQPKPLAIDAKTAKDCAKEGESVDATDPTLLIGSDRGIANVVVQVEVQGAVLKVPEKPFILDQKTCHFDPHVAVVAAGTTVELHNSDTVGHNVHVTAIKNASFNETVAPGSKRVYKVDQADSIKITCDIHTWMSSCLLVANTNFYAVTGADGSFKIEGLPAGEHKVTYWHEKLGKQTGKLSVGADGKLGPVEIKMGGEKKSDPRRH